MIDIALTLFYTFVALGSLVTFHEFGHFWVARRCGVKVETFSIGFGKTIFSWHDKYGTEFVLAVLPLGGYVKMLDERTDKVNSVDLPRAFTQKTPWQRMAIIIAGPMANFLLAGVIFWMIFLGGESGLAPVIGDVKAGSPAEQSGFEVDMTIVELDNNPVETWSELSKKLFDYVGTTGSIPFSVIYPDSDIRYQLSIPVTSWLSDKEVPMLMQELGLSPSVELETLTIAAVVAGKAGERDGLLAGDRLVSIDDQKLESVQQFMNGISGSPGRQLKLGVKRQSADQRWADLDIVVTPNPELIEGENIGRLGIQLSSAVRYAKENIRIVSYGPLEAVSRAFMEVVDTSVSIVKSIGKLIMGELSPKNLSGPITIAKVAGDTAKSGLDNFIRFVAILSIMLGVMNLLPIPVLDGGHLVFIIIELLKGSPVSEGVQIVSYKAGLTVLMSLMIVATFNDLMRSF
ncbi:MAG: RIP metalloprotease RseP [Porticoccaceae bacterium]|nr:RIP metalloprotease RseP [Porticoccaceae bacterium]MDG1475117.1 RIP metalloprotease RseP [Porticoccaceae bacterium]